MRTTRGVLRFLAAATLFVFPQIAQAANDPGQARAVETAPCITGDEVRVLVGDGMGGVEETEGCLKAIYEFGVAMTESIIAIGAAGAGAAFCVSSPSVITCGLALYLAAVAEQSVESLADAGVQMDRACLAQEEFLAALTPRSAVAGLI